MSKVHINDGTGNGFSAGVTSKHRLLNDGIANPPESVACLEGDAFAIHAVCRTAAATSGAFLSITNNDPNFDMQLTRLYFDPQTLTDADLLIMQVIDTAVAGGTDVSATAVSQKNTGTAKTFDLTVIASDASSGSTYTGGNTLHAFPINSRESVFRDMNGANVITAGKTLTWGWALEDGSSAVDNQIVAITINVIKVPA